MFIAKKYADGRKKKVIGMLKALIKKIEKDEFSVVTFGFWTSQLDQKILFRVDVTSKDSSQDKVSFNKYL